MNIISAKEATNIATSVSDTVVESIIQGESVMINDDITERANLGCSDLYYRFLDRRHVKKCLVVLMPELDKLGYYVSKGIEQDMFDLYIRWDA